MITELMITVSRSERVLYRQYRSSSSSTLSRQGYVRFRLSLCPLLLLRIVVLKLSEEQGLRNKGLRNQGPRTRGRTRTQRGAKPLGKSNSALTRTVQAEVQCVCVWLCVFVVFVHQAADPLSCLGKRVSGRIEARASNLRLKISQRSHASKTRCLCIWTRRR